MISSVTATICQLTTHSSDSIQGEVFVLTLTGTTSQGPILHGHRQQVLDVVPRVVDPQECFPLTETTCGASIPSRESIISEVFVPPPYENYILGTHTTHPSS